MAGGPEQYVLNPDTINENVKKTVYAVRGELYLRAAQLQAEGKEITFTNVGNPHALGQQPITFPRQVMALCQAPFLMDNPECTKLFAPDAIQSAKKYLGYTSGGVGAYSDSRGHMGIRKEVAEFIHRRDGYPCNAENIFLTDGASKGVQQLLQIMIRSSKDGIMCPIPQYPLYSATIELLGGTLVPYYLDEARGWGLSLTELKSSINTARSKGIEVRALVFINPGNPTGQCLTESDLRDLIKFCHDERLVLMADEVYQENVFQDERPFISARRVMKTMGPPYSFLELVSYHSVSKGSFGECGQRGGYLEMCNLHPAVVDELYKMASLILSPNVNGQIMMGLQVTPPKPGDFSYEQYTRERKSIIESMRRRAHLMTDTFNSCQGFQCNFTEGAMYSFPRINLPPRAVAAAKAAGKKPDVFYCLKLLEATGISTVPGSGFGQQEGTFHLRTTILPTETKMPEILATFKSFNEAFMKQYSGGSSFTKSSL